MSKPLSRSKKTWFRGLQVLVILAVVYFLGRNLIQLNWSDFLRSVRAADRVRLALSLALTVSGGLLVALGWGLILRVLGQRVSSPAILRIYYLSELVKYVPGKIWTAVGRVIMLTGMGVPRVITVASVGIMLIILALSGVLVTLISLPLWPRVGNPRFVYLLLLVLPLGLLSLHPRIFTPIMNWALRKLEHCTLTVKLAYSHILLLILFWSALWILKGWATYLLFSILPESVFAAHPLPPHSWMIISGIMALSWIVGAVSPFTPAGLGIAELSIVVLLGRLFSIPADYATLFAVFTRLWGIIAELICVAITYPLKK